MAAPDDLTRMRREYDERQNRSEYDRLYSPLYSPFLFSALQRQRDLAAALRKSGLTSLRDRRILEIGCGRGGILQEYLSLGANPQNLFGIDILLNRLRIAHHQLASCGLSGADGRHLPFEDQSFDLVLQYTAFSSVLDAQVKQQMAQEMLRVLKADGTIIWYDFWLNPTNAQTRGIRPGEMRSLFPATQIRLHKITLAPPIARKIVPVSWLAASLLEALKIANTHYLALIRKSAPTVR